MKNLFLIFIFGAVFHNIQAQTIIVNADGTHSVVIGEGDTKIIVNPDGTHSHIIGNGKTKTIVNSNGTHSTVFDNGTTKTIVNPDGTHSTVIGNGKTKIIVNPDGTHSTLIDNRKTKIIVNSNSTHSVVTGNFQNDATTTNKKKQIKKQVPFYSHQRALKSPKNGSQTKKLLMQDYSFIVADGEISKWHQSNDTLYGLHGSIYQPLQTTVQKHFRIISSQQINKVTILKLERLDTILLTTDPYPATRYYVYVFKSIDKQSLGFLDLKSGLTRKELDTIQLEKNSLNDLFFFTYYSDSYLKDLSALKTVTTKNQA